MTNLIYLNTPAKKRVFKEYTPGIYRSDDGWSIVNEPIEGSSLDMLILRNDKGEKVDESYFFDSLERTHNLERYSYFQRTGRMGDTDHNLKFCPNHFPEGTVVKVSDHVGRRPHRDPVAEPQTTFTVNRVVQNGPRSFVLEMKELQPDLIDKGTMSPIAYNIGHVRRIVTPGTGKLDIIYSSKQRFPHDQVPLTYAEQVQVWRDESREFVSEFGWPLNRLKKDEIVVYGIQPVVSGILHSIGLRPENEGKWVNFALLIRFIESAKLGRKSLGEGGWYYDILNIRKLRAWLVKNQHRIFHTLDLVEAEDDRISRAACENAFDDSDDMEPFEDDASQDEVQPS